MLWQKAWRESRARFLVAAAVLAALCALLLLFEVELRRRMSAAGASATTYDGYVYSRVYRGVVRAIFAMLAALLALGGLHREHAHGTLGFTLALPVGRARHVIARAGVGLAEVCALAALPAVLVPACSALAGEAYPWPQAAEFALLWAASGALIFGVSLVVSAVVRSDLAALAVAIVGVRLSPVQLAEFASGRGMPYFDPRTDLLVGAVPWLEIAGVVAAAAALVAIAALATVRERFA